MGAIVDRNATYGDDQTSTADIINNSGTQGALTVGTTAVEVKVGVSRLVSRKSVTLYNNSSSTVYWGYNNTVTISTGTPIQKDTFMSWSVGESVEIWVISDGANRNTRITEGG